MALYSLHPSIHAQWSVPRETEACSSSLKTFSAPSLAGIWLYTNPHSGRSPRDVPFLGASVGKRMGTQRESEAESG